LELGGPVLVVFPAAGVFTSLEAQAGTAEQQIVAREIDGKPCPITAAALLVSPSSM
jgi:hypothetical protein